jgi:hypothetical protein
LTRGSGPRKISSPQHSIRACVDINFRFSTDQHMDSDPTQERASHASDRNNNSNNNIKEARRKGFVDEPNVPVWETAVFRDHVRNLKAAICIGATQIAVRHAACITTMVERRARIDGPRTTYLPVALAIVDCFLAEIGIGCVELWLHIDRYATRLAETPVHIWDAKSQTATTTVAPPSQNEKESRRIVSTIGLCMIMMCKATHSRTAYHAVTALALNDGHVNFEDLPRVRRLFERQARLPRTMGFDTRLLSSYVATCDEFALPYAMMADRNDASQAVFDALEKHASTDLDSVVALGRRWYERMREVKTGNAMLCWVVPLMAHVRGVRVSDTSIAPDGSIVFERREARTSPKPATMSEDERLSTTMAVRLDLKRKAPSLAGSCVAFVNATDPEYQHAHARVVARMRAGMLSAPKIKTGSIPTTPTSTTSAAEAEMPDPTPMEVDAVRTLTTMRHTEDVGIDAPPTTSST